ncbi:MAG: M23 family metallopeptidase [Mariprofundaceae bacterium]|nr:M23 family metallopeptidase [Mariprofundaceae bacterium]
MSKSEAIYQVRAGDTLYSVSKRHGTDYRTLARRNHLHYPYTIYTGQRLYLRGVAPRPSYIPLPKRHKKPVRGRSVNGKKRPGHGVVKPRPHKRVSTARHRRVVRLSWPVRGKVTSKFGRRHGRPHDGIDISVPEGTPVRAAAEGDVVYSSRRLTGYGNLIIIRHTHDMFTAYAHNQSNLVRRGTHVKRGEIIARAGRTGHASGPHVHFEVRRGPTPVNPLVYLPKRQRKRR